MPLAPLALAALLAAAPDEPTISEATEPGEELPAPRRRAAAPIDADDEQDVTAGLPGARERDVDEPPRRRERRPEEDPDDGAGEEELTREVPRVLTPPGFGRVRFELQAESGVRPGGALDATLGLELRIGLVAPVALTLGGGGAFWPGAGDPTWVAHAGLRAQAPLEPAPWFEGGVTVRGALQPLQAFGGLGVALSLDDTQAVSLGARGLFAEGELGVLGVVGLYFAP